MLQPYPINASVYCYFKTSPGMDGNIMIFNLSLLYNNLISKTDSRSYVLITFYEKRLILVVLLFINAILHLNIITEQI